MSIVDHSEEFSNGDCEVLSIRIPSIKALFSIIYRPQRTTNAKFAEALCKIEKFKNDHTDDYYHAIMGDFNCEEIKWVTLDEFGATAQLKKQQDEPSLKLIDFQLKNFLSQHVTEPIRYDRNGAENTLDLFFL